MMAATTLSQEASGKGAAKTQNHALQIIRRPRVLIPLAFLVLMAIISLAAPLVAPHSHMQLLDQPLISPGDDYLL